MNQQTEIDVKGRQNEEMEIDLLELLEYLEHMQLLSY